MIKIYFILFVFAFINNSFASISSTEEFYKPRKTSRAERFSDEESDQKSSDEEEKHCSISKNSKPGKQPKLVKSLPKKQDSTSIYAPQNDKKHAVRVLQAFPSRRDSALGSTPIEMGSRSVSTRYNSAASQTPNNLYTKNSVIEDKRPQSLQYLSLSQGRLSSSLKRNEEEEEEVRTPSRQRPQNNFFNRSEEEEEDDLSSLSEVEEKEENSAYPHPYNSFNEANEEVDEELNKLFIENLQMPQSSSLEDSLPFSPINRSVSEKFNS